MSRPQFHQLAQNPGTAQVVNGGLIDFQDNQNRGQAEFLHAAYQQAQAQGFPMQQSYHAPATLMHQAMGAPGQAMQQAPSFQVSQQQMPGAYISGPPSYLHINGVTYKPVDEPTSVEGKSSGAKPVEAATSDDARVMTEDELERAIDKRVQSKVETFLSTQHRKLQRVGSSCPSAEEFALRRVQAVNASMRPKTTARKPARTW